MAISKDASFLAVYDMDYAVSSNLISITPYTAKVSFVTGFKMFSASQLASKHGFDCKRCGRREKHALAKGPFILICCCDYPWLDRRIQLIPTERQSPCWETSSVGIQGNAVPYGFSPWIIYHFFSSVLPKYLNTSICSLSSGADGDLCFEYAAEYALSMTWCMCHELVWIMLWCPEEFFSQLYCCFVFSLVEIEVG